MTTSYPKCTSPDGIGGPRCPRAATIEIVGIKPGPMGDEGETLSVKCDYHAGTFLAGIRQMGFPYRGYPRIVGFDL